MGLGILQERRRGHRRSLRHRKSALARGPRPASSCAGRGPVVFGLLEHDDACLHDDLLQSIQRGIESAAGLRVGVHPTCPELATFLRETEPVSDVKAEQFLMGNSHTRLVHEVCRKPFGARQAFRAGSSERLLGS